MKNVINRSGMHNAYFCTLLHQQSQSKDTPDSGMYIYIRYKFFSLSWRVKKDTDSSIERVCSRVRVLVYIYM